MQITLVGKIISLRETETYFDMQLDDGTGVLEVKLYVDSDADTLVSICYNSGNSFLCNSEETCLARDVCEFTPY